MSLLRAIGLAAGLALIGPALAVPIAFPQVAEPTVHTLEKRCENPCGWGDLVCCASNQFCYTDLNNLAQCGNGTPNIKAGYWATWTSVWTATNLATHTATYTSYVPTTVAVTTTTAAATATSTLQCRYELNESECLNVCCAGNQVCGKDGVCRSSGDSTTAVGTQPAVTMTTTGVQTATLPVITPTTTITTTINGVIVVIFPTGTSQPGSGTTLGTGWVTSTISTVIPTTTVPILAPVATGTNPDGTAMESNDGGLSGGTIAGIVIGVLAAVALLALLCFCCIARKCWIGLLALLGLRHGSDSSSSSSSSSSHGSGGSGSSDSSSGPSRPGKSAAKKTLLVGLISAVTYFLYRRFKKNKQSEASTSTVTTTTNHSSDYTSETASHTDTYSSLYTSRPSGTRYPQTRYSQRSAGPTLPPRARRGLHAPGPPSASSSRPSSYRSPHLETRHFRQSGPDYGDKDKY